MIEAVLALALGALVIHAVLHLLLASSGIGSRVRAEADRLAALRVARSAVAGDLGWGESSRDWQSFPPDSVSLRAYRGVALACASLGSGDTLYVRWLGLRNPNPRKDSLAALGSDGIWRAADLAADRSVGTRCPADTTRTLRRWIVSPPPVASPVLIRLWERGSYHVVDSVLSYRSRPRKSPTSRGSRQPISPAALQMPETRFADSAGALSLWLSARDSSGWLKRVRLGGSQ